MAEYKTRSGVVAEVNEWKWLRSEFAYLGTIGTHGWAWHEDGKSIDRDDRAFDLIDFPAPAATYHHWLGADADA